MGGDGVRGDRVLAGVLAGFALAVLAVTFRLPGSSPADPVGPRGFPALLALVLLGCAVALVLPSRGAPAVSEDGEEPRGPLAPRRLFGAIALTVAYLAALEPAGYLLATPPYVAALLLAQERVLARTFLVTVLGLPLVLYLLFAVVMRISLPPGPLEPLLRAF